MIKKNKNCIIYCRVSSQDQVEGTSLESQEQLCREYAARNQLEVSGVFVELGESAKTADRTELNRALQFCRRKKPGFFIVYKLDRFTRNQYDHVTLRAVLRRSGTDLRSATEPIDESPVGKLLEGVLSSVSQFDNDQRTERVLLGMRARVKQGVWVWPAPLGYFRPYQGANIEPDPKTAPLVTKAFEAYATGTYTFQALATMLNRLGLRARRGGPITASRAQQLIQNRVYSGIITVWGEEHQGSFQALVSEQVWEKCQPERFRKNGTIKPRSLNNPLFPLRGFIICSECGTTLTGSRSKGRGGAWFPYYHHYYRGCTRSRFIRKEELEELFTSFLRQWTIRGDIAAGFRVHLLDSQQDGRKELREFNAAIKRDLAALAAERQAVYDLHRTGKYSDEEFVEQRKLVGGRIKQKNRLLRDGADFDFDIDSAWQKTIKVLGNPARTWLESADNYRVRLQFQEYLLVGLGKIVFDGQELRTADKPQFYRLIEESQGKKSKLVALLQNNWGELIDELRRWVEFSGQLDRKKHSLHDLPG
jgi:site-specific DNA recombinase